MSSSPHSPYRHVSGARRPCGVHVHGHPARSHLTKGPADPRCQASCRRRRCRRHAERRSIEEAAQGARGVVNWPSVGHPLRERRRHAGADLTLSPSPLTSSLTFCHVFSHLLSHLLSRLPSPSLAPLCVNVKESTISDATVEEGEGVVTPPTASSLEAIAEEIVSQAVRHSHSHSQAVLHPPNLHQISTKSPPNLPTRVLGLRFARRLKRNFCAHRHVALTWPSRGPHVALTWSLARSVIAGGGRSRSSRRRMGHGRQGNRRACRGRGGRRPFAGGDTWPGGARASRPDEIVHRYAAGGAGGQQGGRVREGAREHNLLEAED